MQTLTIETTRSEKKAIEIPIPFFARNYDCSDYIAILDERTVVNIYRSDNYTLIKNSTPGFQDSLIAEAWNTWHSCTETEFLSKYDEVIESISLHPKLAV